ncbi:MAG: MFS transporter [Alphaproteobacteria bacterium]|nr:MFS transporter [Alphaproteobacteria bacterium]
MRRDGGIFYGYHIVGACGLIQAVSLGGIFTFGVLFPELEREFGWSRTAISGASSFAFFLSGVCAVFMGRAVDRFGPRAVLTSAGILVGLGYCLSYQISAIWELYVYFGLLFGVGIAAHDVGTLSTIARWFQRRRGLMTGFAKAGGGVGQVLVPICAAVLIAGPGWRVACLSLGLTVIILQVGAAQFLKRSPALLGLRPDGDAPEDLAPEENGSTADATHHAWEEAGLTFKQAIRSPILWKLCAAKFCDLFCLFTIIIHIVPYATDHGLAPTTAAAILSTIGAMSILGRIFLGGAFDRIGGRRSLIVCFAVLTLSLVLLQFADTGWSLFLFAMIYGPAHGGFFTITSPSVAEFFGIQTHGTLFGLVVCCGTFGATLGPLVAGGLFDGTGGYSVAFALLLGVSLLGLLVASTLPRPLSDQACGKKSASKNASR